VPLVQGIREGGDSGYPAVLQNDGIMADAFLNVAKNALRQVGVRNETMEPTKVVGMSNV
jgi:ATP-binding protein involved in chromosome partitioning